MKKQHQNKDRAQGAASDHKHTAISLLVMANNNRKITLHLEVRKIQCVEQVVNVPALIKGVNEPLWLVAAHGELQTQLIMTGLSHLAIMSFDDNGNFTGTNLVSQPGSAPLSFLNPARHMLIVTSDFTLKFKYAFSFESEGREVQ